MNNFKERIAHTARFETLRIAMQICHDDLCFVGHGVVYEIQM